MPQKAWAVGEEVLAADMNTYLQNQVVPAFTTAAQRDTQWVGPPNGALCVTTDTNTLWQRVSGTWQHVGAGANMGQNFSTTDTAAYPSTGALLTVNYTAIAGHRYQYLVNSQYGGGTFPGGGLSQYLRDNGNDLATRNLGGIAAGAGVEITNLAIATPVAGAHAVTVLATASAAGIYFQEGWMIVTDLGLTTALLRADETGQADAEQVTR
jgi:hypothetical protein